MDISGKIAIVTGAGSGLGAEAAGYLKDRGARVIGMDLNEEHLNSLEQAKGIPGIQCDVAEDSSIHLAFSGILENYGLPEILVNCAGIGTTGRIVGKDGPLPLDVFQKTISVNLIGTYNMMRCFATEFIEASKAGKVEEGVIINTASVAAFEGQVGQSAYAASKGGIVSMTLPAAREFAQFGIRVMTIAPGLIKTPVLHGLSDEARASIEANIPYPKRLGNASEFAKLVGHIIENDYLNGETIRLDGALRLKPK